MRKEPALCYLPGGKSTQSQVQNGRRKLVVNQLIKDLFECSGCGECCRWEGYVLLEEADIQRLAGFLGMDELAFIERHTRLASNRRQLALLDQDNGSCAFLEGNRCLVYEARPEQCRTFPFAWRVSEGCPALDRLSASGPAQEESEVS